MDINQLWGYVETLLVHLGVWDLISTAVTVIVVVSLGKFALSVLRR